MNWQDCPVLVTGGASFIGSHLVDALVERGARIRVVDDLSSGCLDNLRPHIDSDRVEFHRANLADPAAAREALRDMRVVFHLAAVHGGRGFVDLHQAECAQNFQIDANVFRAALAERVENLVYASSGCVYPNYLQQDAAQELYLTEDIVGPPYDADNIYGWAKLMGELSLRAFQRDSGLPSVSCRYFSVYGERGLENHAVLALVARALTRQDPFEVWGSGEQIRNWTHVSDIVRGTLAAAERIRDASAVNLGTMERIRVKDAAEEILRYTGHQARIVFRPEMPTGPYNRVADNARAKRLLGWTPQVAFWDGLQRTIDWYRATRQPTQAAAALKSLLTERTPATPPSK